MLKKIFFLSNIFAVIALFLAYLSTQFNPIDYWYFSFFGLAFPAIILFNILFIVWWRYRKSKRYLLSLLSILIGFGFITDFFQINVNWFKSKDDLIKVITNNVKVFGYYDQENNKQIRDDMFGLFHEEQADIYCFQEFYHTDRVGHFETRDTLLTFLEANNIHEKYTHHMHGLQYFGLVTFSKYPIINKGFIGFKNDNNNFCIYSDIKMADDTIRVYNVHLASIRFSKEDYRFIKNPDDDESLAKSKTILRRLKVGFQKRAEQTHQILDHIQNCPYEVIFCGDFNDSPISYCYNQFTSVLEDSFVEAGNGIGNTYVGDFPSFRIDYILHSENFKAVSCETIKTKGLSDHRPVIVTLSK